MLSPRRYAAVIALFALSAPLDARAGGNGTPKTYALRADAFSVPGTVQLQVSPGLFAFSLTEIPASATGIVATGNREMVEGEQWLEVTYGGWTGWIRETSLAPEIGLEQLLDPEPTVLPILPPPPPASERKADAPDAIDMTVDTFAGAPGPGANAGKSKQKNKR